MVDAGNPIYDCREECNAIIETGTNTLIAGCHKSTIPASVQRIGYRPLVDCEGLREVTIPDKVTYICRGAFSYCSRLKKVYAYPTVPPEIEQDVFDDIADGAVLYVPKGSIEAYEASDWKQYFAAIRAIRK